MAKQTRPIGFKPAGTTDGDDPADQPAAQPEKLPALVPIQHVGAVERLEILERYQITVVGMPDSAHHQLVQVVRDLERALTKEREDHGITKARLDRAIARYPDLAES